MVKPFLKTLSASCGLFASHKTLSGTCARTTILGAILLLWLMPATADRVDPAVISDGVIAPYSLGEITDREGVWELLNGSGLQEGYVIESEAIVQIPGFSGAAINMMIMIDRNGQFIDVKLLSHNEPIFVSGLGEAPFHGFLEQYRGNSISTPMTVGTNYGKNASGSLIYLDGVSKATASVRIAHESLIAATREVAKSKLQGLVQAQPSAEPNMQHDESLSWDDLVEQGIAKNFTATHGEERALYQGTLWQDDDAHPDEADSANFVDLWVVDIGPPAVARAIFANSTLRELEHLRAIATHDEPVLLIESANHGLVGEDFVRNTTPATITATQDGLPVVFRDADLFVDLLPGVPSGEAMIVRTDRRLGFNPVQQWQIGLVSVRQHGQLYPQLGQMELNWEYVADERFYLQTEEIKPLPPWQSAIVERWLDIALLALLLVVLTVIFLMQAKLAHWRWFSQFRWGYLLVCVAFIGWWGQGQLSIVTPLAVLHSITQGKSLEFLLYDPFSLLIWLFVIASFLFLGRAAFCGWLCPFGALQGLIAKVGKALGITAKQLPQKWDQRLKAIPYISLGMLVLVAVGAPTQIDGAAEIEPFKTAISVFFQREWWFVLYALICLFFSLFVYKAYCRYLCPLGAFMALGGLLRQKNWITRRAECGSPCQLCKVRCDYQAIKPSGKIAYSQCFGCLDCVQIYHDRTKCAPLIVQAKKQAALQSRIPLTVTAT